MRILSLKKIDDWCCSVSVHRILCRGLSAVSEELTCCEHESKQVARTLVLLKTCTKKKDLIKAIALHAKIRNSGELEKNTYVVSALVNMYAKCGALEKAADVLADLPARNVTAWNALISGYAQDGHYGKAFECLKKLQQEGFNPSAVTFVCLLKACGCLQAVQEMHKEIKTHGLLEKHIGLGTVLVDMYLKMGEFEIATQVFEELRVRDAITWNVLITGYVGKGQLDAALMCFEQLQQEGLPPSAVTFICILKACGTAGAIEKGKQVQEEIARYPSLGRHLALGKQTPLKNALLDMYAKCGEIQRVGKLFFEIPGRDVVSWGVLISGCAQHGYGEEALKCYDQMRHEGFCPNEVTYISILKACGNLGAADMGQQIHDEILKQDLLQTSTPLGNCLIDMYIKCGLVEKAAQVFSDICVQDVVSWSALIAGYLQEGRGNEALKWFEQMQSEGLSPDTITLTCILKACGSLGALTKGEQIHNEIAKQELLKDDVVLGTSLIDMYAKCGALPKAAQVLTDLPARNLVSWNALITGYVQQGRIHEALNCLERMQLEGISPDAITLMCLLTACSRLGLQQEGQTYFTGMSTKYGIMPTVEHHTCMIDLFSRAGEFDKALAVMMKTSSSEYIPALRALLSSCQECGNAKLGKMAFESSVQVSNCDASAHNLQSKI